MKIVSFMRWYGTDRRLISSHSGSPKPTEWCTVKQR